jgi:hypothetical protein
METTGIDKTKLCVFGQLAIATPQLAVFRHFKLGACYDGLYSLTNH